jgi:hypothetical protein
MRFKLYLASLFRAIALRLENYIIESTTLYYGPTFTVKCKNERNRYPARSVVSERKQRALQAWIDAETVEVNHSVR